MTKFQFNVAISCLCGAVIIAGTAAAKNVYDNAKATANATAITAEKEQLKKPLAKTADGEEDSDAGWDEIQIGTAESITVPHFSDEDE
jgi:hypothetical protein